MASPRQLQVMKHRVMEKLDDIFSQQKTIIATINTKSSEIKKKADSLLKTKNNEVTISDFVNVLQDLERCFNNLIAISATTDDLFNVDDPNSNSLGGSHNLLAQDSLSEYQVKWSNQDIPEFHPPQRTTPFNMTQPNQDNSLSSVESIDGQSMPCDSQNFSDNCGTTNQYSSDDNTSVNFQTVEQQIASGEVIDPPVDFTEGQMESVPQWANPNLNSDYGHKSMSSNTRSPGKDIASIPNIVSVAPFSPKSLSIEEPYCLGPELKYQKVTSVTNVQVCETVTPYCFWVQLSSSVDLLGLTTEIQLFISSSKYNTCVDYGIVCPCVGMTCIAPFTDGAYYRARVLSEIVQDSEEDTLDTKVNVLYVDYGNMDFIPTSSLFKMPKSLAKFRTQAICCALANVMPPEMDEEWSPQSSDYFHNMVYSKVLVCHPVLGKSFVPQIVDLYLLESTESMTLEDLEIMQESNVTSILIEQGFAQSIGESCQIQKIRQTVKNWTLFKSSCFPPDQSHNLLVKEKPPGLSAPFNGMPQSSEYLALHQQSFPCVKESNPGLNFDFSVSGQTSARSSPGVKMSAFSGSGSGSGSAFKRPNYDTAVKDRLGSSGAVLDQCLLQNSSKLSQRVTALDPNCTPDFKNSSATLNSQAVVSKSGNHPVTAAVKTMITSSGDGDLCGSMENLNSCDLSAVALPPHSICSSSSSGRERSLSADLGTVGSKSDSKGFHAVMISHVASPSSFYVHHISEETSSQLEKLVQDLNRDFQRLIPSKLLTKLSSKFVIENGKLCCTYFADEGMFYRGLIIEHKAHPSVGVLAQVFYIDFGNCSWLHSDKIYPLPSQYSKIPALARHCALAYVHPIHRVWTKEATEAFKSMIKVKETYFIMMVAGSCSTLELPSLANYQKAPVEVLLTYCGGSGSDQNEKTEICLNYDLIDLEHAELDIDSVKSLVEWDPMSEDFDSRRNQYEMNIDDAEIAAVGFKVKDELKICKFFRDGRNCWLGERCRYKHIRVAKDCLTVDKRETVCDVNLVGQIELPRVGSMVGVEVSAVNSPVQFYVICPWGTETVKNLNTMPVCPNERETLPDLQESLQEHYRRLPPRTEVNLLWTIGELVVAQTPADEQWNRARVCEVSSTRVKVFFVDFGNGQWINEKLIQPIQPQFVHLPHQAIECCLDGIASASNDGLWTQEAREYFMELVNDGVLVAHVNCITLKRLYINLYNTSKDVDRNIAEDLVRVGVARRVSPKHKPSIKSPFDPPDQPESAKKNEFHMPG